MKRNLAGGRTAETAGGRQETVTAEKRCSTAARQAGKSIEKYNPGRYNPETVPGRTAEPDPQAKPKRQAAVTAG